MRFRPTCSAADVGGHDPVAEIAAGKAGPRVGAFFDLDGTLVSGFTATAHAGARIRGRQARIGEILGIIEAATRYRLGRMQFDRLITRAAGYLRGETMAGLDELGEQLFTEQIAARLYPQMAQIVRAHQVRGHTVVLSSSALTIHVEPVARHLGISQVLCNRFELDDRGLLTGTVIAPIIWGPQKAAAVQKFCAANDVDLQDSYFYADGDEDAALMYLVGHPRPVNPRARLSAIAAEHRWPVLSVSTGTRSRRRLTTVGLAVGLLAVSALLRYAGLAPGARTTIGTAGKCAAISERDLRSAAVP